ncbi:putative membrane protein YgcG [Mycobacterium sp. OTB74]|nr:putative membrane protein YgcG [Mycobacterium sp. OTB74]
MLDAPTAVEPGLTTQSEPPKKTPPWWQRLHATKTQRTLLLAALGGLLIAGVLTLTPSNFEGPAGLNLHTNRVNTARVSETFDRAKPGDCLNWPANSPGSISIVDCKDEHRFEVAQSLDLSTFPGSEYGHDAPPPSEARTHQMAQEQCQNAARQYLGPRFDPNGKFSVSLVMPGEQTWKQKGERHVLCGLQLLGPENHQLPYKGRVADVDQSKVWPAGTCLGIDPATNQLTDIPVDCSTPHSMEVTGAVNLADKYHDALPAEPDQLGYLKDECTKITDAYLAPVQLRTTTLTPIYSSIALPSWSAGSRQVSCSIGSAIGNGGWSTLVNSAKGQLLVNGQPPAAPPAIPDERLNLSPIPVVEPPSNSSSSSSGSSSSSSGSSSNSSSSSGSSQSGQQSTQGNQHLPGGASGQNGPPPQGNTFLNGPPPGDGAPPPPAGDDVPPPPGVAPPAGAPPAGGPPAGAPPGPAEPIAPPAPGQ